MKKNSIISKGNSKFSCNRIPGRACFSCPHPDCITKIGSISKEEQEMNRCGVNVQVIISPHLVIQGHKLRYQEPKHKPFCTKMSVKHRSKKYIDALIASMDARKRSYCSEQSNYYQAFYSTNCSGEIFHAEF